MTVQVAEISAEKLNEVNQLIDISRPRAERIVILVCAYNESHCLPNLLPLLKGYDVLVVDDGSTDGTGQIAETHGTKVLTHKSRMGKAVSVNEGISYALSNRYDLVINIDADALPVKEAIERLIRCFDDADVGGASCIQIPIGPPNVTYYIDELIWALLAEGKRLQITNSGSCYLGAVMHAFRPYLMDPMHGYVNEDERLDESIRTKGYRVILVENATAYFDASSCLGHILERRRRMYYGHFKMNNSNAPSMQTRISIIALARAIKEKPKRTFWLLPAVLVDFYSRLLAWRDSRMLNREKTYANWVTTYFKNDLESVLLSNRIVTNCRQINA